MDTLTMSSSLHIGPSGVGVGSLHRSVMSSVLMVQRCQGQGVFACMSDSITKFSTERRGS